MSMDNGKGTASSESPVNWQADPYWRNRRLSPAQLLIYDIRLEGWKSDTSHLLEIKEVLSSSLLPDLEDRDRLSENFPIEELTPHRTEQHQMKVLANEYGWMQCLRSHGVQKSVFDPPDFRKCRWIHIASKFSEYLQGCLLALSDWSTNPTRVLLALRQLDHCVYQNERFSKHGRYFSPFFQHLDSDDVPNSDNEPDFTPMLLSIPFLDWTVSGSNPPLRFQIDPREGYQSAKTSSHLLRSILQHFYRLEDTRDREHNQVFSKHKPWTTDRSLDLKVRRWYGYYPTGLNVDELWILVIDPRHIVTFSSNQSWKSRWPPLQLASRVAEVSFRGLRNNFFLSEQKTEYTALTHTIAVLNGAVGLLHRSFWTDITLCLTDRYAGYLGHLQYRLHRAPSTKLVMDLLQVQEELNIVIQIMQQQIDLVKELQASWKSQNSKIKRRNADRNPVPRAQSETNIQVSPTILHSTSTPFRATFRQYSSSTLIDPTSQLLENLHREFVDLRDLRDNSNSLLNRTIQLVNIRLEDHGKAILVFTIVTIIFLPLSFVSSFYGMNFSDIRDMGATQSRYWVIAATVTAGVVAFSLLLAFYGGALQESFVDWKGSRRRPKASSSQGPGIERQGSGFRTFQVLDAIIPGRGTGFGTA